MSTRHAFLLGAVFLLGCLAGNFLLGQPTAAQQPAAQAPPGRYQMVVTGGEIFVGDSGTGECWSRRADGTGKWLALGSPPARPK